ncbi:MAG: PEP-utilizing enzyme, partial [Planctomycetota bacterium]|nr:PEP-utilizing enzyme [Planctomycetota bacterium]
YGYRNLRSFPLLVNFAGLPYIDVRVSFNSFVPEDVEEELAERLINYYLDRLVANPKYHDKVEFEVIFSCYTFDLPERITLLEEHGFDAKDTASLTHSLRRLTQGIIDNKEGLWIRDTAKLHELQKRQNTILRSDLLTIEKIYWLVEDCKRYGTLPFAGLARAGFIAVQMLKSLVAVGIFSDDDYDGFMRTLNTVSSTMSRDLRSLSRSSFLQKYGHLRPGTYNILSPRYDEAPDRYFDWKSIEEAPQPKEMSDFKLGLKPLNRLENLLAEHEFDSDVLGLFHFIQGAIEGREYAKFIFSKSLSDVISLIGELGHSMGLDKEEMSYTNIREILDLYSTSEDLSRRLQRVIDQGKHGHEVVKSISLPPLITRAEDVWNFELPQNEPNFITQGKVVGVVVNEHTDRDRLKDAILMIPSADPGYDWIFSHAIGGFITQYGGANSHMAIRAGELGIPAIVGAGEIFYQQWGKARILDIDCGNRQVQILQ